jgi:hypothetical protein
MTGLFPMEKEFVGTYTNTKECFGLVLTRKDTPVAIRRTLWYDMGEACVKSDWDFPDHAPRL